LMLRRALDPGSDFDPILPPNPGDWLAEHYEEGQTHDDFIRTGKNKPDALRNTIYRSDARPMSFCPVCLRKIHHSVGFDVIDRYRRLLLFHENIGFTDEARWLQKRLKRITGHDNGK
ncbi:MAG: hypothetical protein JXC33_01620, partial [Deltaproteobacteria bacterium]|nr:hypothetical protein [Deltaproteobacteria bacterium]